MINNGPLGLLDPPPEPVIGRRVAPTRWRVMTIGGRLAASRQFRFRNLLRQPRPQRRQPLRMVAPFADRGRIDRTAYLNGAGGRRRRRAFVEPQHLIIPGKPAELNEKPARRRL